MLECAGVNQGGIESDGVVHPKSQGSNGQKEKWSRLDYLVPLGGSLPAAGVPGLNARAV